MTILTATISLCNETVLALAAAHIAQFAERLELKGPGVRVADCRYYLELWKQIRAAVHLGRELGSEHLQELYDAATCGDHDALLTVAEWRMVHEAAAEARAS